MKAGQTDGKDAASEKKKDSAPANENDTVEEGKTSDEEAGAA
jgi:hypothetical protein